MLTPEQAEERLKAFKRPDGAERRAAAVEGLSGELREIGRRLLELPYAYTPDGRVDTVKQAAREQAFERLDGFSASDRTLLFEAFFPQLGRHVEALWTLGRHLPYQAGMTRQSFRAPESPRVTIHARRKRLESLLWILVGFEQDIRWVAEWSGHLMFGSQDVLGLLLAAAIEGGGSEGDEVFRILHSSAGGEQPVATMGRHVPRALLTASRPEGWEAMERMLLAAQRQEGLRQVILEAVDEAHPQAFRRILGLVLKHDLLRFSSAVRALDVWFGGGWEAAEARRIREFLLKLLPLLDDPEARAAALHGSDPEAVFLALWCVAVKDATDAVPLAVPLLRHPEVGHRFAAAHLLASLGITGAGDALVGALADADLRVAMRALDALGHPSSVTPNCGDVFERLEELLARMPSRPSELDPILWPWCTQAVDRKRVTAALIAHLGERPVERLTGYLADMPADQRAAVAALLADRSTWTDSERSTLVRLVGDPSGPVREMALKALEKHALAAEEIERFEAYLTRKSADLRLGVLAALLRQDDNAALASADRLLAGAPSQRTGGLEVLRRLAESGRAVDRCRSRAEAFRAEREEVSDLEQIHLRAVLGARENSDPDAECDLVQGVSLEDALGLMDAADRSAPTLPISRKTVIGTAPSLRLLRSLDALIQSYHETPVRVSYGPGWPAEEQLLGDIHWLPQPNATLTREDDLARFPLREVLETWWSGRGPELRDPDGLEGARAAALVAIDAALTGGEYASSWERQLSEGVIGGKSELSPLQNGPLVKGVLGWLYRLDPDAMDANVPLDLLETVLANVPVEEMQRPVDPARSWWNRDGWRSARAADGALTLAREHRRLCGGKWSPAHHGRFWGLLRWIDQPAPEKLQPRGLLGFVRSLLPGSDPGVPTRQRPTLEDAASSLAAGVATAADLYDLLLGPREAQSWSGPDFSALRQVSGRKPSPLLEQCPALAEIVERCRGRIVEIELARGDTPTAATQPARALRYTGGMDVLLRVLRALGKEPFSRGYSWGENRQAVLSHLLRHTFPAESDTFERFRIAAESARLPEGRLVEAAVYAPQWAAHVEHTLGWTGLSGGVWWVHAHTRDQDWSVDAEMRQAWEAEVAEFTPLSGQDLTEGAVDVQWFRRVYAELGPERWKAVYEAAKYASSSGGHTRARLFAESMLGSVTEEALVRRVEEKRHQDSVRAIGLLPLITKGDPFEVVLQRYRTLQEFLRGARKFGAMRQESEKRAAQIGLENLARTAGYPDPIRLTWALEARETSDLSDGARSVTVGDVTVSLSIEPSGAPKLAVTKNGKPLKSVPAALKKHEEVAALRARETEIKRQGSRVRQSLEQAMVRGDAFTPGEIADLMRHPVLAPSLFRLVLLCETGAGYPTADGRSLRDARGRETPIHGEVRIAHPFDLMERGDWHEWQQECFRSERVQPFKQVFRELYVLTPAEREEGDRSRRYEGHQVNPRQALALLSGRGWVSHPEEGIRKTYHQAGITSHLDVMGLTFTAADVEGLTLETIHFTRRGEWQPIPLDEVPPRLFSEAMRDLDLVVSVAHRGGVDPEASASTVEMRAALVAETCELLGLSNVRVEGRWALIEGRLGKYSLHLGSAVVHRQPGSYLCIVPVHSQHRGRLFLPFADDDPKTAEVLSKTLLLARDHEIKDPTILEQIRARG